MDSQIIWQIDKQVTDIYTNLMAIDCTANMNTTLEIFIFQWPENKIQFS